MTAVEWLIDNIVQDQNVKAKPMSEWLKIFEEAKEMEKQQIDNKAIHFAEWLTKKHTTTLMALYEQFEQTI